MDSKTFESNDFIVCYQPLEKQKIVKITTATPRCGTKFYFLFNDMPGLVTK